MIVLTISGLRYNFGMRLCWDSITTLSDVPTLSRRTERELSREHLSQASIINLIETWSLEY